MEEISQSLQQLKCAVIVAHPDDETLWAGGTILMNPDNEWNIITLCRKNDPDRSPKFYTALKTLNASGRMGDIDDGPEQAPLNLKDIEDSILELLPGRQYDLIITHSTQGEYTRHRRHEETAEAVIHLIETEQLKTKRLWMFAYEDGNCSHLPKPIKNTDKILPLPGEIWKKKYQIMTQTYGFAEDSWEARTTPKKESFWSFRSMRGIKDWIHARSILT